MKHSAMKFAREFLCGPVFSSHPGADLPGNCVYLSKTPPASPPWVHQVRFPPAGSEVPGLCTPVHNSVFLETVMTPSEQGCLNRRHGNTACWERSSSTRASHGVGPGAWSSLAPGGHRLPTGVGPGLGPASFLGVTISPIGWARGLVQPRSWGVTVFPLGWARAWSSLAPGGQRLSACSGSVHLGRCVPFHQRCFLPFRIRGVHFSGCFGS